MRPIARLPLDPETAADLEQRQRTVDEQRRSEQFNSANIWKSARTTATLRAVFARLQEMMGVHERCMYCHDSHGSDIEHFWPKAPYPQQMFCWPNLLLCCAECGRFKGDRFPLDGGEPLLVDPTVENPWDFLDFDPDTGNLVARFDIAANDWSAKGEATVQLLQLDRREALSAGYRRTFLRLVALVRRNLAAGQPDERLPNQLLESDDHGLLGWCLNGSGQNLSPFATLRDQHPQLWRACLVALDPNSSAE